MATERHDVEEITDDEFLARLEARTAQFDAWQARRGAARSKLIELGLTGEEVDAMLEGPAWQTGDNSE